MKRDTNKFPLHQYICFRLLCGKRIKILSTTKTSFFLCLKSLSSIQSWCISQNILAVGLGEVTYTHTSKKLDQKYCQKQNTNLPNVTLNSKGQTAIGT
jgi:hypothetical protein